MGYDIENRLTTLSYNDGTQDHRVEYTYGANSFVHIIQKYVDDVLTEETRLVRDGYLIVQERDGSNTALRSYVWSSSALGGIGALTAMVQNSQVYYYLFDGRGNVASVVDESANRVARYVYDAFGELRSVTGSLEQPFRFSTKYYDDGTGLVDFGYRFYVSETGRWLTRDPIGIKGGINLYGYVRNNPINFLDPLGLAYSPQGEHRISRKEAMRLSEGQDLCGCFAKAFFGYAEAGLVATEAVTGPYVSKPRGGIAGGGRAGSKTSVWSTAIHEINKRGEKSATTAAARIAGRLASRAIPYASIALLIYDITVFNKCIEECNEDKCQQ